MQLAWPSRGTRTQFTIPEFLWVVAIVLGPLDAVLLLPYTVLDVHLSLPRLAMLMAVAVSFLAAAWAGRVRLCAGNVCVAIFLSWLGWNIVSGLWAVSQMAYGRYVALIAMNGFLFLSLVHIATSAYKYHFILKSLWCIILVSLLFGLVELISGYRLPASRQWAFRAEITSLFVNPIHFGGALAMFAPFALMYPVWLPRPRPRIVIGAAVGVALAAYFVLRSGSRGAALGLLLGCATALVLALAQRRAMRRLTRLGALLAVLVLSAVGLQLVPAVPRVLVDKLATLGDPARLIAEESRVVLWEIGWQLWTESPIVGWGAGASEFLLMERAPWLLDLSLHAWIVETLVNTGIVGSALWALLVVVVFFRLLKRFWRSSDSYARFLASSLLGGLLASVPISLTVGSLATFPLYWVHLALCAALALRRGWTGNGSVWRLPLVSDPRRIAQGLE